jgi:lipid-A-disaccharide synthase
LRIFVSTADASGDLHAAALLQALRWKKPELEVFGLGGPALEKAGLEPVARQSELAVAGLVEVVSSLPRILGAYWNLRAAIRTRQPDLVCLVDSPDLNLPLAAVARRAGVPVLYYIVPQVWAWRPGRLRTLARRVDRAAVIFPAEEALLREAGVAVTYVGHPLVERLAQFRRTFRSREFANSVGLDPERPVIGLLPGSRRNELELNLPIMLEAAGIAREALPELQRVLILAPTLEGLPLDLPPDVRVASGRPHEAMAASTCLLSAAGTATIEATILGIPFVVVHRVHPLSFAVARRVIRVPSACMTNLVADAGVVAERIQDQARPTNVAGLALQLLRNADAREKMRAQLAATAARLGGPGASERTAELALELAGGA